MKHTEELMVMTAYASGMSFEKAYFAHLYKNRDFLAQNMYVAGLSSENLYVFSNQTRKACS